MARKQEKNKSNGKTFLVIGVFPKVLNTKIVIDFRSPKLLNDKKVIHVIF